MPLPVPQQTGTPFWAWILIAFGGCLLLSVVIMGAFGLWIGTTDNGMIRSVYAATNPDFDILEYSASKALIRVRHKATRREFDVHLVTLKANKIDYRMLATKIVKTPDWLRYPGTEGEGVDQLTRGGAENLRAFYDLALVENDFDVVRQEGGFIEACNAKTIECAVVSSSPAGKSGKIYFSATYRIVPGPD